MSGNKKQRQRQNSKRIGKLVLPIYKATSKAIIKSNICKKYNKIQFYEILPTNKTQVRVAYVMMVHSMHRAAAWRRVPCAAQFCAATRCVVVVSRECRGAKTDYFPSILILEEITA